MLGTVKERYRIFMRLYKRDLTSSWRSVKATCVEEIVKLKDE